MVSAVAAAAFGKRCVARGAAIAVGFVDSNNGLVPYGHCGLHAVRADGRWQACSATDAVEGGALATGMVVTDAAHGSDSRRSDEWKGAHCDGDRYYR